MYTIHTNADLHNIFPLFSTTTTTLQNFSKMMMSTFFLIWKYHLTIRNIDFFRLFYFQN